MKRLLLPALVVPCLLFLPMACGDPPVAVEAPPVVLKPKPKVFRPADLKAEAEARDAALDKEIADLEAEAEKLRQEISREQLASDRAALTAEQSLLEEERTALLDVLASQTAPDSPLPDADPELLPPMEDYDLFYSDLGAYGQWFESVDYGYVWQPAVAIQSSWRPYTVGCWTACDSGWVWLSEEPFGWATYHYGRWACLKDRGWIWVPGEVWAPAWVAWCRSPEYVGWCPLPPETLYQDEVTYDASIDKLCGLRPSCYIFIAAKHFCLPVHRHGQPAGDSARLCRNATNITRLHVSRGGVDRSGPGYDWIRKCLGHAPPKYRLTCETRPPKGPQFRIDRDRLCLYSPRMRTPWNPLLRPGRIAGNLTISPADRQDATPPDKISSSFREARRSWQASAAKAVKEAPVRRFAERQEHIRTLQTSLTTAASASTSTVAQSAGQTAVRPAGMTSVQRRDLRNEAAEKVASQRQTLNRMRGIDEPGKMAPTADTAVLATAAKGNARSLPGATPPPASRTLSQSPQVRRSAPTASLTERSTPASTTTAAGSAVRNGLASSGPGGPMAQIPRSQPEPVIRQAPQTFRHATTTAIIPGTHASNDQAPAPGSGTSREFPEAPAVDPALPGTDPREGRVAQLKEEIAVNRQALVEQQGTLPRSGGGESAAAAVARQRQDEERIRQQSLADEQAAALAEAAAAQQQAEARAREETAARQFQQDREAARQAEQANAQRATMERAAQQEQQQAAGRARAGEIARQQEAARQQQMAEQRQRQVEEMTRQQEAARQQQMAEQRQRQVEEMARQQEAARQQQMAEQRQRQAAEMARQQEAARQQQIAEQHQRQAEAIARQQEAARQQQMAEQRQRQAEDSARQKEAARQQQESAQRQRQAEETARQQESVRRQKSS